MWMRVWVGACGGDTCGCMCVGVHVGACDCVCDCVCGGGEEEGDKCYRS